MGSLVHTCTEDVEHEIEVLSVLLAKQFALFYFLFFFDLWIFLGN